jgi:hypothetical protein
MPNPQGGTIQSGLDRALEWALDHQMDEVLERGSLDPREFEYAGIETEHVASPRPWQRGLSEVVDRPGSDRPLVAGFWEGIGRWTGWSRLLGFLRWLSGSSRRRAEIHQAPERPAAAVRVNPPHKMDANTLHNWRTGILSNQFGLSDAELRGERWEFKEHLTGVVMVHGIGPHLAGQTLLDWTRPIITLLRDAKAADATNGERLLASEAPAESVDDPVFRSKIDFSGETFPVIQVRIPKREGQPADAPEPRWIFTETWWASEVRPPSLRTMVGWLGEQGGVGRIVQGIQRNTLGNSPLRRLAALSIQPFVSVVVSFALLLLVSLLTLARLIPFGPLRDAVTLRLASAFLTDWFGGARTLLREPAQSANVRGRLVTTIKALRAYGCRNVVLVAHSGGTIVSWTTLTDPAYPRLNVQKLITIGEAINLGWRLEAADSDSERPKPPAGNRLNGNLAAKEGLIWRDFWATHDPAPSGAPNLPSDTMDAGKDRFTAERVYNRLSIGDDHGRYWENDEHFLIPLIREIDVPTGDRTGSRFYSDAVESKVRAMRKERVSILALWRRATFALPLMAILAAALVGGNGLLPEASTAALSLYESVPFHKELVAAGRTLADLGTWRPLEQAAGLAPEVRAVSVVDQFYRLGVLVLQLAFVLAVIRAIVPSRLDGLWWNKRGARIAVLAVDLAIGIGAFVVIVAVWLARRDQAEPLAAIVRLATDSGLLVLLAGGAVLWVLAWVGRWLRKRLRMTRGRSGFLLQAARLAAIVGSTLFLGSIVVGLVLVAVGVLLVFAGNSALPDRGDSLRAFVLGGVVIVILFRALDRLGQWRWETWDVRERRALRQQPSVRPARGWPAVVAATLTVAAIGSAIIAAVGVKGATLWGLPRDQVLGAIALLVVAIIAVTLAKDVVDNDIDVDDGRYGGAGSGKQPAPLEPDVAAKAPG